VLDLFTGTIQTIRKTICFFLVGDALRKVRVQCKSVRHC